MKTKKLFTAKSAAILSTVLAPVLGAAISMPVYAEQPSFNQIEGGYIEIDDDFSGYTLRGKVGITDNFYVTGGYSNVSHDELEDFINGTAELSASRFGVGTNFGITDNTAVYGQLEYLDLSLELDSSFFESDSNEDGYIASVGIRSMLTNTTELYGELAHNKVEETQTIATAGIRQYFTDNLGVFAEYSMNDYDSDGYAVGVSFKF
ncbi:hypothetical protein TDB9533_02724 [Thalassocella blandensis]|nr:hypothetical protein TDB9533_02724 [Thalassocella blandensis]